MGKKIKLKVGDKVRIHRKCITADKPNFKYRTGISRAWLDKNADTVFEINKICDTDIYLNKAEGWVFAPSWLVKVSGKRK